MRTDYEPEPTAVILNPAGPTTTINPVYGTGSDDDVIINEADPINEAYPDRGIDGNNAHDPSKGAALGAIGGVIVGGVAGGPLGALVGGVAGAAASGAGVAAVDEYDNDNSPGERHVDPLTGRTVVTEHFDTV